MNSKKQITSSTLSPCSSSNTTSPTSSPHSELVNILIDNSATSLDKQLTRFNQDQKLEEDRTQSFLAKVNARITSNMINNSSNINNGTTNPFNFETNVINTSNKSTLSSSSYKSNNGLFANSISNRKSTSKLFNFWISIVKIFPCFFCCCYFLLTGMFRKLKNKRFFF